MPAGTSTWSVVKIVPAPIFYGAGYVRT